MAVATASAAKTTKKKQKLLANFQVIIFHVALLFPIRMRLYALLTLGPSKTLLLHLLKYTERSKDDDVLDLNDAVGGAADWWGVRVPYQ